MHSKWEWDTFNCLSQSRILGRVGLKDIQLCPECFWAKHIGKYAVMYSGHI